MEIIQDYPPNIEAIRKRFILHKGTVFAYGNIIYNPDGNQLNSALIIHEETHQKQQGNDVEGWWKRYLENDQFRLSQEIEAYRNQYKETKRVFKDKNKLDRFLRYMVQDLSSEIYGNMISVSEARKLIVT